MADSTAPSAHVIRRYRESDWPTVWALLHPIFEAGETYAFAPDRR